MLEQRSMRQLVLDAAGCDGNHKHVISIAAERAGLSYRTVKSIYFGEIKNEQHKAVRKLSEAAKRNIPQDFANLLGRQASNMERADPEMYGDVVASLRAVECALRNLADRR